MKICFVYESYPTLPPYSGFAMYVQTAARALAARGHEVHVLVGRRGTRSDSTDGPVQLHVRPVRAIPLLGRWLWGLGESICLAWALFVLHRKHRFDVAEFPDWEGMGLATAFLRFVPVVVRLHTATSEAVEARGTTANAGERFGIWAEKTSARLATATVTHSHAHARAIEPAFGLRNVPVIPHGIMVPEAKRTPAASPPAVLCVGKMNPRKGTDTLLAAIPLVLKQVPEAEFWLAGEDRDGRYEKEFHEAFPQIAPGRVRFLQFVSDEQLAELYQTCAVYASASNYESFGFPFVEAMAREKPVVACAVSAMLDVIENETTGLLVPPRDPQAFAAAIVRLLRDPGLRQRFGEAGRRLVVERYSAERMARDLEDFLARFLVAAHDPATAHA